MTPVVKLAAALILCLLAAPAFAQSSSSSSSESVWGKPADLKPMIPPLPRVFIPPNSAITSGAVSSGPSGSTGTLYDPTRDQATPGLRLSIPTR